MTLEEWTKGENKEGPRKPIDQINANTNNVGMNFEKGSGERRRTEFEPKVVDNSEAINQLKDELKNKDVFILFIFRWKFIL